MHEERGGPGAGQGGGDFVADMAGLALETIGTVVTIPVVIFGFLIQKHLVKGFSFGMIRR